MSQAYPRDSSVPAGRTWVSITCDPDDRSLPCDDRRRDPCPCPCHGDRDLCLCHRGPGPYHLFHPSQPCLCDRPYRCSFPCPDLCCFPVACPCLPLWCSSSNPWQD